MSSRCRDAFAIALVCACVGPSMANGAERVLRVCADPDNLPYSNRNGAGFENRIAEIIARELGTSVGYTWHPQLRGFVRKTLNEKLCDVLIGVPTDLELVRTTKPYYRSAYVFVYRAGERAFDSFDDERLMSARIGVQLVGNDLAATPPGHALAGRGITQNVVGFPVLGDGPQAERIVRAVADGTLDVAVAWGPPAAYYARLQTVPLAISAVRAAGEPSSLPFEFSLSMGVRRSDNELAQTLNGIIDRRQEELHAVLAEYGVPEVAPVPTDAKGEMP